MKLFKRNIINIVFTDNYIRFVVMEFGSKIVQQFGNVELRKGVIVDGRIENEVLLMNILSKMFKKYNIKENNVKIIVPDKALVIRKLMIPTYIEEKEIKDYLRLEMQDSIYFPFDDPVIDYCHYRDIDRNNKEIILFTISYEIISAYDEILKKLGKKLVDSVISPIATRSLYKNNREDFFTENEFTLCAQIHQKYIYLSVFNYNIPILSVLNTLDKYEYDELQYFNEVEDKIERLIHFYKYHNTTDQKDLDEIVIGTGVDLNKQFFDDLKTKFKADVQLLNTDKFISKDGKRMSREYYLPLAMSIE